MDVALGAAALAFPCGEIVLLVAADGLSGVVVWAADLASLGFCCVSDLGSGVLAAGGGVETAGAAVVVVVVVVSLAGVAVRALESSALGAVWGFGVFNCEWMMAGSTGAPLTVEVAVGALLAGGVYLLLLLSLLTVSGGKSCRLTPLYLLNC